jgi:uncharacterized protein Yka (UPF0111/DUF47 family)
MKSEIIERLGQTDILLPALIAEGLAANDRVKARLSVLQAAARHARDPHGARFDLTDECRAAGLDAVAMQTLVNGASLILGEQITTPGLGSLAAAIFDDVATMARAVKAADAADGDAALERLSTLKHAAWPETTDCIASAQVARVTGLSDGKGDSLHRLIMDLHKALNRLSAAHAEEILAGAHVHGLLAQDRPAVEAFMRGVEATRKLKFDHPGLATTATRSGARLTIQNDIGETEAHVVVIAVEADAVTVTYTDVHLVRAKFFTGLLRNFPVHWSGLERKSAAGLGDDEVFYLVTGRCLTDSDKARDAFLEAIGASLVFLIDWNKARKILQAWVAKGDAVRVLDWAARHRFGHRGFLALGGSELVASAVHHATPTRIGFGERLDRALGRDAAVDFLKTVLRVSAEALLEGGSIRLARDRIEADLMRHLQRVDGALLAIVVSQAGLARDIATGIAQFIAQRQARQPFDREALANAARRIEEKADKIVMKAREEIARFDADPTVEQLVNRAEEAIDELEQAAFLTSLLPGELAPDLLKPLAELCAAAVRGAEAAASGTAAAANIPDGQRVDAEDALAAVDRLIEAEHNGDTAERALTAFVLRGEFDLKTALSVLELARALERSTDRLAGFGHLLRRHVLTDLSA